jgi:hypothetical protein
MPSYSQAYGDAGEVKYAYCPFSFTCMLIKLQISELNGAIAPNSG